MQDDDKDSVKDSGSSLVDEDSPKDLEENQAPGSKVAPEKEAPQEPAEPNDEKTESAVDDIAEKEGDAVLAAEDAEVQKAFEPKPTGRFAKFKDFIKRWWNIE